MDDFSGPTLVLDTSFGLTAGIVGHAPIYEEDSRSHVEKIEPFIASVIADARLKPQDIQNVVVGTGPAPFTGLRAGIVSAKAFAFATGATLLGQNVLEPQAWWNLEEHVQDSDDRLVLALNDARRKQLYFQLFRVSPQKASVTPLGEMDIQNPQSIAENVLTRTRDSLSSGLPLDIVGHGAAHYSQVWETLPEQGVEVRSLSDASVVHADGVRGPAIFAQVAKVRAQETGKLPDAQPLYLRRPDVELPPPLKPVLEHHEQSAEVRQS